MLIASKALEIALWYLGWWSFGGIPFPVIAFDRNNIRDKNGAAPNPAGSAPKNPGNYPR
jgi:hypothetical protein